MIDPETLLKRFDPVYCWTEEGVDENSDMAIIKEEDLDLLQDKDHSKNSLIGSFGDNIKKYEEVIQKGNSEEMRELLIQSKKREIHLYDKIEKLQSLLKNAHLCLSGVETFVNQKKAFEYQILTDPSTRLEMKFMADRIMEL